MALCRLRWDHPRGCGEKVVKLGKHSIAKGSSPRVRGKGCKLRRAGSILGIIPAGAGKRGYSSARRSSPRDHPRGCGEKRRRRGRRPPRPGSSPRVRGKDLNRRERRALVGIIPAGAGKRKPCRRKPGRGRDHPRGCGEKLTAARPPSPSLGSSPRVRGKGVFVGGHVGEGGIIPAGAGKRPPSGPGSRKTKDHPRGCGEKAGSRPTRNPRSGSSPRVRGEGRSGARRRPDDGIIPAGAGRSRESDVLGVIHGDHPRGCGEKPPCSMP